MCKESAERVQCVYVCVCVERERECRLLDEGRVQCVE
jgi:hypothetical protein